MGITSYEAGFVKGVDVVGISVFVIVDKVGNAVVVAKSQINARVKAGINTRVKALVVDIRLSTARTAPSARKSWLHLHRVAATGEEHTLVEQEVAGATNLRVASFKSVAITLFIILSVPVPPPRDVVRPKLTFVPAMGAA